MDTRSLLGLRNQIGISQDVLDRNDDGAADTAFIQVTVSGKPDLTLTYYLDDVGQNGNFNRAFVALGDAKRGNKLIRTDSDHNGDPDQFAFRFAARQEGIDYEYRDLDCDGRVDMMTMYDQNDIFGGYILRGTEWHKYDQKLGDDWRRVELKNPQGATVTAAFKDGKWQIEGDQNQ